jgi:ribosomal protein S27AE
VVIQRWTPPGMLAELYAEETPEPAASPMPACPRCQAPMTWVEAHRRWFCGHCRIYI